MKHGYVQASRMVAFTRKYMRCTWLHAQLHVAACAITRGCMRIAQLHMAGGTRTHDHWHPLLPNFPHPAESEGPGHLRLIFEEALPTRGGYPPLPCEDNIPPPLSHAKVTSPLSCQNNILEDNKLEEVLGGGEGERRRTRRCRRRGV